MHRKSIKHLRSALAFALTLWCAGAGCMIVSYAHASAMENARLDSAVSHFGHVTGSAGSHACCKARRSSKQNAESLQRISRSQSSAGFEQIALPESPSPGSASCCPLTSGSFVTSARPGNNFQTSIVKVADAVQPKLTREQITAPNYPLHLPNQEQTYLRICSFLI
jgi:hypothetical protein